jgi:hypothetical protein
MTNGEDRMTRQKPGDATFSIRRDFVSSIVIRISSLFHGSRFRHWLFFLLLLAPGCTSIPTVVLKPVNSRQSLKIDFGHAYFAPSESGDDRIVLLSEPMDQPTESSPGDALAVNNSPPIWQVLLIQLHWRTSASPKEDSLVANNAVLHWYVYGKPRSTSMGVLHYVGSGSVSVSTDSNGADVTINHAELKLLDQHGQINDPFQAFQIRTDFRAQADPARLQQSLDDVEKAISQADQRTAAPATLP